MSTLHVRMSTLHVRYLLPDRVLVSTGMLLATPVPLPGEVVHLNGSRCQVLDREWWWSDGADGPVLAVDVKVEAASV